MLVKNFKVGDCYLDRHGAGVIAEEVIDKGAYIVCRLRRTNGGEGIFGKGTTYRETYQKENGIINLKGCSGFQRGEGLV